MSLVSWNSSTAAIGTQPQVADPTGYIADPGPLGLASFAMTTFVLSVFNAGFVTTSGLVAVVLPRRWPGTRRAPGWPTPPGSAPCCRPSAGPGPAVINPHPYRRPRAWPVAPCFRLPAEVDP
ncbi:MAG: GPR1/FUN34/YaaH family transporter [Mycobacterium sp.]|uniref:GPR1/FUN34/YaaH family transporter n=1 Tax=Mycobacterium sp. TaxID=1785 RepID=UPI003F97879D